MKLDKLLGVVACGALTLGMGVGLANATISDGGHHSATNAAQVGKVDNGTEQYAKSASDTGQKNFNAPFGSRSGDVDQSNWADTNATSKNSNDTSQSGNQDQYVKGEGRGSTNAKQFGAVSNWTGQHAKSYASTEQKNFNAPVSYGHVKPSYGSKEHDSCGCSDRGKDGKDHGKSGDVRQSNKADTNAKSKNSNYTSQSLNQNQDVKNEGHKKHHNCGCQDKGKGHKGYDKDHGKDAYNKGHDNCGCQDKGRPEKGHESSTDASQVGKVSNWTEQGAASKAETTQYNINVPISIGSFGSGNGSVDQSNKADTNATSKNYNDTDQSLNQDQSVNGGKGSTDAEQLGSVENGTEQAAKSKAATTQYNINVPISIFSPGSNNGNVSQSNGASTNSTSVNGNGTTQSLNQLQQAA